MTSGGKVQFSSVQRTISLNLELNSSSDVQDRLGLKATA